MSSSSPEKIVAQPPGPKNAKVDERALWKIFKGKYMLAIYLCDDDWRNLFENKEKVRRMDNDRLALNFEMCENCARVNCNGTDILAPSKKRKLSNDQA
ncbi:hypothetical protein niasHT_028511 [Heterodera trifolii]|uniref:Uncharacterized protein n=1 Tax=Heterodera trifolii TaxID=157864 RepID=A0ABD2JS63_9BILA